MSTDSAPTGAPQSILIAAPAPGLPDVLAAAEELAHTSSNEEIAAELEALEAVAQAHARTAEQARTARGVLGHRLLERLGDGEAVEAPSGRMVYRGLVAEGKSTVREDVALELAPGLPDDLRPRQEHRLPTVTALKAALKAGRIDRSTYRALVAVPRRVHGLRWRTLDDFEGES